MASLGAQYFCQSARGGAWWVAPCALTRTLATLLELWTPYGRAIGPAIEGLHPTAHSRPLPQKVNSLERNREHASVAERQNICDNETGVCWVIWVRAGGLLGVLSSREMISSIACNIFVSCPRLYGWNAVYSEQHIVSQKGSSSRLWQFACSCSMSVLLQALAILRNLNL